MTVQAGGGKDLFWVGIGPGCPWMRLFFLKAAQTTASAVWLPKVSPPTPEDLFVIEERNGKNQFKTQRINSASRNQDARQQRSPKVIPLAPENIDAKTMERNNAKFGSTGSQSAKPRPEFGVAAKVANPGQNQWPSPGQNKKP